MRKNTPGYKNITCTLKECSSLHCVSSIPAGKPWPPNILVTPQNLSRCCVANRHWIISHWINQTEVCFAWQQQRCLTFTEGATERLPPYLPPTHTKALCEALICNGITAVIHFSNRGASSAASVYTCTARRVLTFQPFHFFFQAFNLWNTHTVYSKQTPAAQQRISMGEYVLLAHRICLQQPKSVLTCRTLGFNIQLFTLK